MSFDEKRMLRDTAILELAEQGWSPFRISEALNFPVTLVESTIEHHRAGAVRAMQDLQKYNESILKEDDL